MLLGSVCGVYASKDQFSECEGDMKHRHKRFCQSNARDENENPDVLTISLLDTPPPKAPRLTISLLDTPPPKAPCLTISLLETPPKNGASVFPDYSPKTKVSLWGQGVNPDVLCSSIRSMLYSPEKQKDLTSVRDPNTRLKLINKEMVPSPCVRKSKTVLKSKKHPRVITRSKFPKKLHFGDREAVPVVHLKPGVSKAVEPKEQEEERIARRRNQRKILQEARTAQLGQKGEDAWSHEESTLNLFVKYLDLRKEDPTKIRKKEIEEILNEILSSSGYQSIQYENYVVWFCVKTMFLGVENQDTGLTNFDAIGLGRPPQGFDGKSMHLHHGTLFDGATHNTKSYLILLSNTAHSEKFAAALHFSSKFYWKPKEPVDRLLFDPRRPHIFKKIASAVEDPDSQSESFEVIPTLDPNDDNISSGLSESS